MALFAFESLYKFLIIFLLSLYQWTSLAECFTFFEMLEIFECLYFAS